MSDTLRQAVAFLLDHEAYRIRKDAEAMRQTAVAQHNPDLIKCFELEESYARTLATILRGQRNGEE